MTIQNIFKTIDQTLKKNGNIQLLSDIQNGKLADVKTALDKLTTHEDIETLFTRGFENGKTLLHAAFSSTKDTENEMKKYLLKKVGNNLKEVLAVTNNTKKAPLEMILSGKNDDFAKLEAIIASCQDDEQKKAILQYQNQFNQKTFLHAAATKNKIEQDFFKNVFAKAKELKILEEVLTAKDNKKDTAAHKAIATKKEDVKNAFFQDLLALEKNELVSVFKAQGENNRSLFLTAVLDKDTALINQLFDKLKDFSTEEIKDILVLKNSASKMTIKEFFKLSDFESKFNNLADHAKQAFTDVIIEQIVGKNKIGKDYIIEVNKLAPVFETNQAEFLKKVELNEAAEELSKKFPDVAIKAKLSAEETKFVGSITGVKAEKSINLVTLKTALDKIEEYNTKFKGKTPENFGDSLKAAVTTKLNEIEKGLTLAQSIEAMEDGELKKEPLDTVKDSLGSFALEQDKLLAYFPSTFYMYHSEGSEVALKIFENNFDENAVKEVELQQWSIEFNRAANEQAGLEEHKKISKQKGSEITNYFSNRHELQNLENKRTKLAEIIKNSLEANNRLENFKNEKDKKLLKFSQNEKKAGGEIELVLVQYNKAKNNKAKNNKAKNNKASLQATINQKKGVHEGALKELEEYESKSEIEQARLEKSKALARANESKHVKAISDRKSYFVIIKFLQNMDDVDWFITNVEIKLGYAPYKTSKNWISENISNNSIVGNDGYVSTDIVKYTALVAGAVYSVYTKDMPLVNTALSNKYVNNEVDKQLVNLSNFVKPYIGDQNINKVKEIYDNAPKVISDISFKTLGEDQIQGVMDYGSNNIITVLSSMAVCIPSSSKKSCLGFAILQHSSQYISSFMPDSVQTITKVGFSVMNFGSTVTSDISYGIKYFAGALDVLNIVHTPYNYFYPSVEVETENM